MTNKDLISHNESKKKRESRKVFEVIPFDITGKKSCMIDEKTKIFIGENQSCSVARRKFLATYDYSQKLYNTHLGGRVKGQKYI